MPLLSRIRLPSLVYLSSNWISLTGVVIVTTATVFWLFLLPTTLRGQISHPYIGILVFLLLPAMFVLGLLLIPAGILYRHHRDRAKGRPPATFLPVNWRNPHVRRLVIFVAVTTVFNIVIASQLAYGAVNYMDSTTFCGLTCHRVMDPEYRGHQNSPHARVACVACHIGPGASWFVRSKLAGTGQVFHTIFHTYPRPIPVPVEDLRPARETCEVCHWPQRFEFDKLVVFPQYAADEANTLTKTVLLLRVGGGSPTAGIHGAHVGPNILIRYTSDPARQKMFRVEYTAAGGKATVYDAAGAKLSGETEVREMDCIDCHNRPSHPFQPADRALNNAMAAGDIPASLPFVKKQALAILQQTYATKDAAAQQIPAAVRAFYREKYPDTYARNQAQIGKAAQAVLDVYNGNVFPDMRVTWGTYADNIGHTDSPGCFRCHDGNHVASGGETITQDCGACHNLLAVEESNPKILSDLGISAAQQ